MPRLSGIPLLFAAGAVAVVCALPASGVTSLAEPPLATSSNVHLLTHIPGSAAG